MPQTLPADDDHRIDGEQGPELTIPPSAGTVHNVIHRARKIT